jgi:uncharacterized protein YjbI with pentapeptide repeats
VRGRFGRGRLGCARLGCARLGSARLGEASLGEASLGEASLGEASLGEASLGEARHRVEIVRLGGGIPGTVRLRRARNGWARYGSVRLIRSARNGRLR